MDCSGWGVHYFREAFVVLIYPEPISGRRSLRTFFRQPQSRWQLIKHSHEVVCTEFLANNSCPEKSFISPNHIISYSQLQMFTKVFVFPPLPFQGCHGTLCFPKHYADHRCQSMEPNMDMDHYFRCGLPISKLYNNLYLIIQSKYKNADPIVAHI